MQKVTAGSGNWLPYLCPSSLFPGTVGAMYLAGVPGTARLEGSRWELSAQFPGKCSEICLCYSPKASWQIPARGTVIAESTAWLRNSYE